MTTALVVLSVLLVAALVPGRLVVQVGRDDAALVSVRVCWPLGLVGVGWLGGLRGSALALWLGDRAVWRRGRTRRATGRTAPRKRPRRPLWHRLRALAAWTRAVPGLVRLARALLRATRPRVAGHLAIGWDDPVDVYRAQGLAWTIEGTTGRSASWLSLTVGRPSFEGDARLAATLWLPALALVAARWLMGPDGRRLRALLRDRRALERPVAAVRDTTKGGTTWTTSPDSSSARPSA